MLRIMDKLIAYDWPRPPYLLLLLSVVGLGIP